jgi:hypothetical protein
VRVEGPSVITLSASFAGLVGDLFLRGREEVHNSISQNSIMTYIIYALAEVFTSFPQFTYWPPKLSKKKVEHLKVLL